MENIVLTIHLLIAATLIIVVLLQRSEGGGLGIGGGGGVVSSRGAATALGKLTWILGIAFVVTSLTLTVLAARQGGTDSVLDRLGIEGDATSPALPPVPGGDLLPPIPAPPASGGPATPPPAEGPATPPAGN
jgi:preprotein translocase subunit SecG